MLRTLVLLALALATDVAWCVRVGRVAPGRLGVPRSRANVRLQVGSDGDQELDGLIKQLRASVGAPLRGARARARTRDARRPRPY